MHTTNTVDAFTRSVRAALAQHDLTGSRLAELAGVNPASVSHARNGKPVGSYVEGRLTAAIASLIQEHEPEPEPEPEPDRPLPSPTGFSRWETFEPFAGGAGLAPEPEPAPKPEQVAAPEPVEVHTANGDDPTGSTYAALQAAWARFNTALFDDLLPPCLITFQRRANSFGYFSAARFEHRDSRNTTDEIAINPKHIVDRPPENVLSTLAHEMVHLQQHAFGKPGRGAYHNKEWGTLMDRIGLTPTDTGKPGGKRTGSRVTHLIVPGGPFDRLPGVPGRATGAALGRSPGREVGALRRAREVRLYR